MEMSDELKQSDIVCAVFTPVLKAYGHSLFLMGTSDGGIIVCNPHSNEAISVGQKRIIMAEEIGHISVNSG